MKRSATVAIVLFARCVRDLVSAANPRIVDTAVLSIIHCREKLKSASTVTSPAQLIPQLIRMATI